VKAADIYNCRYRFSALPQGTIHFPFLTMSDLADPAFANLTAQLVRGFRTSLTDDASVQPPEEVTRLAGELSRMAKANGIPPEALLTRIKAAWTDAALTRGYPSRSDWYDQLVMHCLEEYYMPLVQ
jgi:hypothetical protein